ncbi:hypothetical protein HZF05_07625 [Sphingomonas sp. CGMCC 1.13654]|uniref:Thiamine pyrophosphate-binding protein n=2 Tax=Sphingomonas chungangi TaxID=2683589 RepID=A0A838L4M9_9SPHN|nr:hypothetical protein [Sphingomonas chungangi]MVW57092.1 hypothetical protein [Sphingomonas chungangi]
MAKKEGPAAETMTGGDALVRGLKTHGVDTVFALPGAQIYGLSDALAREAAAIRTIGARHEQTTAYMAYGYARASARPGVFAVVPGPGILNASAALLTAHSCNAPILALTGDVPSAFKDRGRGALHELPDQLQILRSMTKYAAHVALPEAAPGAVADAFQAMQSGRRGAAAIQAPWDFFDRQAEIAPQAPLPLLQAPEIDHDAVVRAARLINAANAPMIFVGSGALDANAEVTALAERLNAPVVSFRGGRGVVSDDHPLGFTVAAGQRLWPETDLAIVIGSRFELLDIRWRWRPKDLKIIRVDIDPAEFDRIETDVDLHADAAGGARALLCALEMGGVAPRRQALIAAAKSAAALSIQGVQPQVDYLRAIRDVLPHDGIFVDELSQVGFASIFGFPVYQPRTLISAGYQGTLGFGFPTALGAKVACPDRAVVSVTGDGGFLFAAQELVTAVQYGINLVTIVFNNGSYGNVLRDQATLYEGRLLGSELVNPDFLRFARACGVEAHRVHKPVALRPVLERALAANQPILIEVAVPRGSDGNPWPLLHPSFE